MDSDQAKLITELWIARTAESYPQHASALASKEPDPFRNPVRANMRQGLSRLLAELFSEMDSTAIDSALDPIIRLQAVQGATPDDTVRFVTLLKPILHELAPTLDLETLHARIDHLAVIAVNKYGQCREQLSRIRANEVHRTSYVLQRIHARRPA